TQSRPRRCRILGAPHPGRCRILGPLCPTMRHRPGTGTGGDGERGSIAVEFVILAPLLIGLMLFLVLAGRVVESHGQVDGAARDAARAASVARSAADAQAAADQAVTDDVGAQLCQPPEVRGYAPGSTAVVVTLHCTVNL